MDTRTFTITVAGESREVVARSYGPEQNTGLIGRYQTPACFLGFIGRGIKTHRVSATVWRFASEAAARRRGYRPEAIVARDEDGSVWAFQGIGHALNRQVHVRGWCDRPEDATSNHIMEGNTARKDVSR